MVLDTGMVGAITGTDGSPTAILFAWASWEWVGLPATKRGLMLHETSLINFSKGRDHLE